MRVDIYQRNQPDGSTSYLLVPEGRDIPNEATNIDWQTSARGLDITEDPDTLQVLAISAADEQIARKGYAITSLF